MSSNYKHTRIPFPSQWLFASLTNNAQSSLAQHMKNAGESSCIHYLFKPLWHTGTCRGKMLWRQPSRLSSLLHFTTLHNPLVFLLLLCLLVLWVVDADGELASLCAVLVLDQESVFARVSPGDRGDYDAGKLSLLKLEFVAVVRQQLLVILRPGHLRCGITPDIASQVEGLKRTIKLCLAFDVRHTKLNTSEFSGKMLPFKVKLCIIRVNLIIYLPFLDCNHIWQASNNTSTVWTRNTAVNHHLFKPLSLYNVTFTWHLPDIYLNFRLVTEKSLIKQITIFVLNISCCKNTISINKILILCLMQTHA